MSLAATAAVVGIGAGAVSIANGLSGSGGGNGYTGTSGGSGTNFYIPNNLGGQDTNFQNQQNYITGQSPWPTIRPMYQNLMQQGYNNPYAANYQDAGTQAGQQFSNFVAPTLGAAGATYGAGGLIAGAQDLYTGAASNPYGSSAIAGAANAGQQLSGIGQGAIGQAGQIGAANMEALPGLQGYLGTALSNPYGQQTINAAGTGGGMVQGQATSDYGAAGQIGGAAGSVLNTAFDPQNALYAQEFQKNTDQTRAGLEARGLDTSAAGQGVENQSNQNFNLAWQNAQLGRQTQGLQASASGYGQASGLGTAAGTNYAQGGAMPFQAYTGVNDTTGSALASYLGSIDSLGGNAAGANTLGATGAGQIATGAAMPSQAYQQYYNNLIGDYGNVGAAAGNYAAVDTSAAGLANTGIGFNLNAGATPYNTSQTILGNQGTALTNYQNAYQTAMTPYQQSLANSQAYMGLGTWAQNAYSAAQGRTWQQGQTNMFNAGAGAQGLMTGAKNLYNTFNTPSPSYSSGYTDQFGSGTQGYNPGYNAAPVGTGDMYSNFTANGGFNTSGGF